MRQQLNDITVNDQAAPTRASSVVSGLSRVSRVSSHPSIPNNSTLLAQTPAVFTQASTMATTAPMIRPMATPRTQPSAAAISTAAQTQAMTTSLVGSAARMPTPTRLFSQPAATVPSTPKATLFGRLLQAITPGTLTRSTSVPRIPLNAGASNVIVTTGITNPMFSTPSFTPAQPVTTSQPTSTASNIVTPPTSFFQAPTPIVPPTMTSTNASIPTSAVPQAPTSTVPSFVPPTSASVAAPVSTSAAHPFTPVTTATIHVPTTSNVTHVPVSVPLPPRSSASAPLPPVSSASASSWFSSWRNVGQPNLFGPRQPAQPPSAPPAQPPSAPPAQPPSAPPQRLKLAADIA
ncbi:hypothetical protein DAPPUDRAFT_121278 [Daphnia pulex]|uniref:Uncharacterized protein n=1 Tax=Daphnia pulex TaxID=6669 RepID=E9I300_DAPPU|nr:hypothetical protein DAPPUDRAFT_121278 [Daphnia pulex]|eukprot:EFX61630.1 hypothetical protein DAPPUDRAFT_121278 [Daphnia pulex]